MIPRIKSVKPLEGYLLHVIFDDGKDCIYDVNDDINTIEEYKDLKTIYGLFEQVQLDESRTCVFWNDFIDLPCRHFTLDGHLFGSIGEVMAGYYYGIEKCVRNIKIVKVIGNEIQ